MFATSTRRGRVCELLPVRRTVLAIALTTAALGASSATAPAVVPPKDCGSITAKGKRYNVKADQMTCRTARSWSRTYLERRRKPKGWTCRRYTDTKLVFRCNRSIKNFFAIKR
jgi:hypothetical protein